MSAPYLGLFGGSFDPIHIGHLRIALELQQLACFDRLLWIPCHQPPHKKLSGTGDVDRLAMLQLALNGQPSFELDLREFDRPGPSYTLDTLISLREQWPEASLNLMIGSDGFANLHTWHNWQQLFDFANIIVAQRPGWSLAHDHPVSAFCQPRVLQEATALREYKQGQLVMAQVSMLDISASFIRAECAAGRTVRYLVPDTVFDYIQTHKLYTQAEKK